MAFQVDPGALSLCGTYIVLAVICLYQIYLMRRARHSGLFSTVLALACAMYATSLLCCEPRSGG